MGFQVIPVSDAVLPQKAYLLPVRPGIVGN